MRNETNPTLDTVRPFQPNGRDDIQLCAHDWPIEVSVCPHCLREIQIHELGIALAKACETAEIQG